MKYYEAVFAVNMASKHFSEERSDYRLTFLLVDVERELTADVRGFDLRQNPTVSAGAHEIAFPLLEENEQRISAWKEFGHPDTMVEGDFLPVIVAGGLDDCRRFQEQLSSGDARVEALIEILGGRNVVNRLVFGKTLPALAA